jgi:hypothetical protein
MKMYYKKFVYRFFPGTLPKYQVCTDEMGEQPILSPDDWRILVSSAAQPPKGYTQQSNKPVLPF